MQREVCEYTRVCQDRHYVFPRRIHARVSRSSREKAESAKRSALRSTRDTHVSLDTRRSFSVIPTTSFPSRFLLTPVARFIHTARDPPENGTSSSFALSQTLAPRRGADRSIVWASTSRSSKLHTRVAGGTPSYRRVRTKVKKGRVGEGERKVKCGKREECADAGR